MMHSKSIPKVSDIGRITKNSIISDDVSSTMPAGAKVVPNLEAYSRDLIAKKNIKEAMTIDKFEIRKQYQLKKRTEVWIRALQKSMRLSGIEKMELGEIYEKFSILQQHSVTAIKQGKFKQAKVPKILLEVLSVENVGNCYQIKCQDILGASGV